MDEILSRQIKEMANIEFQCSCGKNHKIEMKHIYVGEGVHTKIVDIVKEISPKEILIVCDKNTYKALGNSVEDKIREAGYNYKSIILSSGEGDLIPDERTIGRLLVEMSDETELLVAVGSGTIMMLAEL